MDQKNVRIYKLTFIDTFQFLNYSLDSLIQNLDKDAFTYLRQEFDSQVLHLVKQRRFYTYAYMNGFGKVQIIIVK